MHIAIVDDCLSDRESLKELIKQDPNMKDTPILFSLFESGEAFLEAFYKDKYDAIFLDILMQGRSGIETAILMRQRDEAVILVFVTISSEYALNSYKVHAKDYLVKPIKPNQLSWCLRQIKRNRERTLAKIMITSIGKSGNAMQIALPIQDILYINLNKRLLFIYTITQTIYTSLTIQGFLALLPKDAHFVECKRGTLVNLDHVQQIENGILYLTNKQQLLMSRRKQKEVKDALFQYTIALARE